ANHACPPSSDKTQMNRTRPERKHDAKGDSPMRTLDAKSLKVLEASAAGKPVPKLVSFCIIYNGLLDFTCSIPSHEIALIRTRLGG
ncbi:hypothetical protein, partial [Pseudophaeobacter leonis]|uniref:hypothetical protein n=1 Tax=Pseudophaeobacter leonis TaxID=1144477 RepID=UPI0019D36A3D